MGDHVPHPQSPKNSYHHGYYYMTQTRHVCNQCTASSGFGLVKYWEVSDEKREEASMTHRGKLSAHIHYSAFLMALWNMCKQFCPFKTNYDLDWLSWELPVINTLCVMAPNYFPNYSHSQSTCCIRPCLLLLAMMGVGDTIFRGHTCSFYQSHSLDWLKFTHQKQISKQSLAATWGKCC